MTSSGDIPGAIFDILTTGSPLKRKQARAITRAIAGVLIATKDPGAAILGATLGSLVSIFEQRDLKKQRRRKNG